MEGGELFQRIQDRVDGAFTERGRSLEFSKGIVSLKNAIYFIIQKQLRL